MYGINHLENSIPILNRVGNITLAPVVGSELANIAEVEINRVLTIFEGYDDKALTQLPTDQIIQLMATHAEVKNGHYDSREQSITNLSHFVADIAKKNIYLAQNVVLPLVNDYTDELNEKLQVSTGISNLAIRVTTDTSSNILNSTNLVNLISQYKDTSGNGYTVGVHSQHGNVEVLKPLLKTGSESFDKFIEEWYNTNPLKLDKLLVDTYNSIFVNSVKLELRKVFVNLGYESALFSILLAKRFLKETPENVNSSLEEYNAALTTVIAAGCSFIGRSIEKYERNIRKGGLILKFPTKGREFLFDETFSGDNDILVDPDVYEEYLNLGGTPEAIVGSYLTSNIVDKTELLERKEELENAYERIANAGRINRLNNRLSLVKNSLRNIGSNVIKDIKSKFNDTTPYAGIEYTNESFTTEINEFIKKISIHDVDDIYSLIRRFICRIFFNDSHIEEMLMKIDALAKDSPDKDVNELAIITSIDFVVEWLVGQLTFETTESGTYQ